MILRRSGRTGSVIRVLAGFPGIKGQAGLSPYSWRLHWRFSSCNNRPDDYKVIKVIRIKEIPWRLLIHLSNGSSFGEEHFDCEVDFLLGWRLRIICIPICIDDCIGMEPELHRIGFPCSEVPGCTAMGAILLFGSVCSDSIDRLALLTDLPDGSSDSRHLFHQ